MQLCVYNALSHGRPPQFPVPPERLRLKPLPLAASVKGSAFLGSLPSLTHVTAFGLLTCALLRPRVLSALVRKSSLPSTTKERPT
jgi:hypothetical protein